MSSVESASNISLRQSKRERSRDAILQAAEALFKREGFAAARMSDIAAAAQVSDKTLFNYFASKAELSEALLQRCFEMHAEVLEERPEITAASIEEVLPPALDFRLSFLHEYRWLIALAVSHTNFFSPGRQPSSILQRNFAARVKRVKQLQKLGVVSTELSAEEICQLYQAIRDHVLGVWLLDNDIGLKALQARFQRHMVVFQQGLKPESGTAKPGRKKPRR
jgi:AcrR family transcriptional regulator